MKGKIAGEKNQRKMEGKEKEKRRGEKERKNRKECGEEKNNTNKMGGLQRKIHFLS